MVSIRIGPLPCGKRTSVVMSAAVALPIVGLGVGTGGSLTLDYLIDRGERGYPIIAIEHPAAQAANQMSRSPTEELAYAREMIPGAVTEFARALNVSRQAIYDWQAGKPVGEHNAARIRDLAAAARVFERAGLAPTVVLIRRRISTGGAFFDLVRAGQSAEAAARALVEIVSTEVRQRDMLRRRLGPAPAATRESLDDVGAPALREEDD